jgi:hypothetical protein
MQTQFLVAFDPYHPAPRDLQRDRLGVGGRWLARVPFEGCLAPLQTRVASDRGASSYRRGRRMRQAMVRDVASSGYTLQGGTLPPGPRRRVASPNRFSRYLATRSVATFLCPSWRMLARPIRPGFDHPATQARTVHRSRRRPWRREPKYCADRPFHFKIL